MATKKRYKVNGIVFTNKQKAKEFKALNEKYGKKVGRIKTLKNKC